MIDYYSAFSRASELYTLLNDELSQKILWNRMRYDIAPSLEGMMSLYADTGIISQKEALAQCGWKERFSQLLNGGKKIFLYGGGRCGEMIGRQILKEKGRFTGFCDKNAEKSGSILGKPVVSPKYLIKNKEDCYVMITSMDYADEIWRHLVENQFPQNHILPYFCSYGRSLKILREKQYFDFPAYYPRNKAFIDAGGFMGETSLRFDRWSQGLYSGIYMIEPDEALCRKAEEAFPKALRKKIHIISSALGSQEAVMPYTAQGWGRGHLFKASLETGGAPQANSELQGPLTPVKVVTLDALVKEAVGFIKLDIEGSEMAALSGAKEIISRDRPFMAVCVYHRSGDVLQIMDYLHDLVPEYRFWLRHYDCFFWETVLYASV